MGDSLFGGPWGVRECLSRGPLCPPRLSLPLAQGMVVSEWGWSKVRGGLLAQGLSELDGACPGFRMAGSQAEGLCPEHSETLGGGQGHVSDLLGSSPGLFCHPPRRYSLQIFRQISRDLSKTTISIWSLKLIVDNFLTCMSLPICKMCITGPDWKPG